MVGGTGVGKSAFLGQVAINVAKQGKRVLLITIENDQTAYMNRLYSNISGVPYRAFKEALSSPEDRGRWLESMADLPEKFHLKLAWFPEGCNASEILFLLQMMPEEIEYLVIDQITNMNPVNPDQYKPDSWQAMGRIALELKRLGDIAYGKGLPILTASQASGGVTEKKELSTDDVAMSKQILRHAHIGFYITRVEDVYQAGASKYRDTRIEPFPVFPDFKCWRIADRPADGGRSVPQPAPMAAVPSAIPPPRIDTPREQEAAMEELVEAEKAELEPDPTPVFGASVPLAPPAPEPAPEALKDSGTTSKPIDEAF
jgi:hypothetical protein